MEAKPDREELLDVLFCGYVSRAIKGNEAKRQAVERYMRTYLRSLLTGEVEFELTHCDTNGSVSPIIQFKIDKASTGYDKFMAKRGAGVGA